MSEEVATGTRMNLLEVNNVSKSFSGVQALKGVSFDLRPSEVHGLVGENGAGKSTLINILAGNLHPDSGEIIIHGKTVEKRKLKGVLAKVLSVIYQDLSLCPDLSIAENIFLGAMPTKGSSGFINKKSILESTRQVLAELKVPLRPDDLVGRLSASEKQLVEIARAMCFKKKIIFMDEPTSALSKKEIVKLEEMMDHLRARGVSIVFISHKLDEVMDICNRITVLKDGERIGCMDAKSTSIAELSRLMVGRKIEEEKSKRASENQRETILRLQNIRSTDRVQGVSFELKRGEILGIYGFVGAGKTELLEAVFGLDKAYSGKISVEGREIGKNSVRKALANGIGLVTEDRKKSGIFSIRPIFENLTYIAIRKILNVMGFVDKKRERATVEELARKLRIKMTASSKEVRALSGGNQQKVLIARWLAANPKILLLDEPTVGIDVGSKYEIYKLVSELADSGIGIICASSELKELYHLADRILVMSKGKVAKDFRIEEYSMSQLFETVSSALEKTGDKGN
jgi:ribose transport system ATP-binding protein